MTAAYTWGIANLERHVSDGIVYTVHWTLTVERVSGGELFYASSYGSIGLPAPEGDIIPYASLTPEIVIDWTKEFLGEEKVAEMEAALSAQIDQQLNPTDASGLPW